MIGTNISGLTQIVREAVIRPTGCLWDRQENAVFLVHNSLLNRFGSADFCIAMAKGEWSKEIIHYRIHRSVTSAAKTYRPVTIACFRIAYQSMKHVWMKEVLLAVK
jgi:hypothetical protein